LLKTDKKSIINYVVFIENIIFDLIFNVIVMSMFYVPSFCDKIKYMQNEEITFRFVFSIDKIFFPVLLENI